MRQAGRVGAGVMDGVEVMVGVGAVCPVAHWTVGYPLRVQLVTPMMLPLQEHSVCVTVVVETAGE